LPEAGHVQAAQQPLTEDSADAHSSSPLHVKSTLSAILEHPGQALQAAVALAGCVVDKIHPTTEEPYVPDKPEHVFIN
jgi:hypothetical protein